MRNAKERRNAALLTDAIIAGLRTGIQDDGYLRWRVAINGRNATLDRHAGSRFPRINEYSLEYGAEKFDKFSMIQCFRIGHARRKALRKIERAITKIAGDRLVETLDVLPDKDVKRAAKELKTWVR